MKKTLTAILSALLCAGLATAVGAAWEENIDYAVLADSIDPAYAKSTDTLPAVVNGELLTGKVFVSVGEDGPEITDVSNPVNLFDGDPVTYYDPHRDNYNVFGGILLDQAYELTEVRIAPVNAEGFDTSANFGILIQGSNDGENWINIIHRLQDATSFGYHIYTPQTVQEYVDAGAVKTATDDSIFWKGKGGSYRMYRVCFNGAGEVEFYGIPKEATPVDAATASAINNPTINYFAGNINIRNVRVESTEEGNLPGYVIGAGGAWNRAVYENAFDGNEKKAYEGPIEDQGAWLGMMFDEPMAITEVRILPKRGAYSLMPYHVQGSNDGVNWVTLCEFTQEESPSKQEWTSKAITDPNGYLYVRYIADFEKIPAVADLMFFGNPAPAGETVAAEPLIATLDTFNGELDFLDETAVSVDGSLTGQIFGYGFGWRDRDQGYAKAWDGDTATHYGQIPRVRGTQYFTGIKPDAPVAAAQVRIYLEEISDTHYLQGSLDGQTWTTLASFGYADKPTVDGWYVKDITDTTEYAYFRWINDGCSDNSAKEILLYTADTIPAGELVYETEAPETAVPETTALETAAPETAAPETAAPETAAPETAAPEAVETDAPETDAPEAPAEKDSNTGLIIGIAAIAVVVVAVAAIVLTKKK